MEMTSLPLFKITELMKELNSRWNLQDGRLIAKFKFKDFNFAIKFVNNLAEIAEKENHHPNINIFYNQLKIELWTHSINSLTKKDFIVASKIDNLYSSSTF